MKKRKTSYRGVINADQERQRIIDELKKSTEIKSLLSNRESIQAELKRRMSNDLK